MMNRMEEGRNVRNERARDILVMEDETSLAKGLKMILEKEGHHVDIAATGHSAMDAFRKKGFDLLVADLRLPDMDGMEVIREVNEKRPDTKTIVITGYPSISSAVDAMRLGVSDYLPKPFWDEEFKAAVDKALKGGRDVFLKEGPDLTVSPKEWKPAEPLQEHVAPEHKGGLRVLLMEDESSLARGLHMVLRKEGYEVELADTGLSAIDSLRMRDFDLLVADLRLPDMDGMEVIRTARQMNPETQVIVITGYASIPSAVDSMKIGALDYLSKPFTEDEFKTAVNKVLQVKKEAPQRAKISPPVTEEERLIQRREVIRILDRTSQDLHFWRDLMKLGSEVLREYHLSNDAKAAVVSGDLKWINENVGELTQKQLKFIHKRLEQEAW